MATSGTVTTSSYDGRYYYVTWSATQSTANNTSTISWSLSCAGGNSSWYAERTLNVSIDGTSVYSKTSRVQRYATTGIASGSVTLSHNTDGSRSFVIAINAAVYTSTVNCTASSTITLDTIARASTVSASSVTLGNSCSVTWTPLSTSFYYKLKFSLSSWSSTTNVGKFTSTSSQTYTGYTVPMTVANQLPSATSGTMTVILYTYSDSGYSSLVGSNSATFTVTVPSTVIPTLSSVSASVVNTNSVISGWGVAVAGYSKVKVTASASGSYSSTISSFTISGGYSKTVSGTSLSYTGSVLSSSGTKTFTVKATDSRSRTSSTSSASVTFYSYSSPSVSKLTASRSSSDSTKIIITAKWSYSTVASKYNSATATLKYKKSSASSWTTYSGSITNGSSTTLTGTFSSSSSYDFQLVVEDELGNTSTGSATASTEAVLMHFRSGGKGLGIGKMAESDILDIDMESRIRQKLTINKPVYITSSDESTWAGVAVTNWNGTAVSLHIGSSGYNRGIYDNTGSKWLMYANSNGATILGVSSYDTYINGSTVYMNNSAYSSDKNIKKDITSMGDEYIRILDSIEPSSYKFIDDKYERTRFGYIAQDVRDALDSAGVSDLNCGIVGTDDSGQMYLSYIEIIPLLHLKIKQLDSRIKELESCME